MDLAVKELKELKKFDSMKTIEFNQKMGEAEHKIVSLEASIADKDNELSKFQESVDQTAA